MESVNLEPDISAELSQTDRESEATAFARYAGAQAYPDTAASPVSGYGADTCSITSLKFQPQSRYFDCSAKSTLKAIAFFEAEVTTQLQGSRPYGISAAPDCRKRPSLRRRQDPEKQSVLPNDFMNAT